MQSHCPPPAKTAGTTDDGRQRAARERTLRERRIAERDFDLFERHAGFLRCKLREDSCTCRCRCLAWRRRREPCRRRAVARSLPQGIVAAIHVHPAIPQPSVKPSRFIEPTSGVRFDQPNFSAPSSKHSSKWRDENGSPSPSSIFGSFMTRSSTGSILSWSASSFIADSVA